MEHTTTFDGLGIAPNVLEILDRLKFVTPTPIQHKAIPLGIQGQDLVGIAQTGTGKTLAFMIPMVQRLAQGKDKGLVLVPTRELASQVNETFLKIGPSFGIKSAVLIGGDSMHLQIKAIKANARVIIATPGRLIDHLGQKNIHLSDVSVLVLDEADRMFDMGFQPQIFEILRYVKKDRQTMLFSATMPEGVAKIAGQHMKIPITIEVAPSGTMAEKITHELFIVSKEKKNPLLKKILEQYRGSVLIFSRMKIGAHRVARDLKQMGFSAAEAHSDLTMSQRRQALEGFKNGRHRVLVATDIAARGIDVTGIELVINYDLPEDPENYVHRIGRTGRAGHQGHAISFATPDQANDVRSIERLIKCALPISEHPELQADKFLPPTRYSFAPTRSTRRRRARRF